MENFAFDGACAFASCLNSFHIFQFEFSRLTCYGAGGCCRALTMRAGVQPGHEELLEIILFSFT
jgi:hypothetical protein